MPPLRIGISGWVCPPWRGTFYPRDLAQKRELAYASRELNSIEINGSFYSLQGPSSYQAWYDATPDEFVFSVKAPRFITHMKRLRNVEAPLANFFASGPLALAEKLGPILWQLPPNFQFSAQVLEAFFEQLPRTTQAAAELAKKHDERLKGRALTQSDADRTLKHALEIRHDSFKSAEFVKLLRKHRVALVVADTAGKWPAMEDITADFLYLRLHGDEQIYVSGYSDSALETWAEKIRAWQKGEDAPDATIIAPTLKARKSGREVYVYFDNDVKVRSPYDAMNLAAKLNLRPPPGSSPDPATMAEEARPHWSPPKSKKAHSPSKGGRTD